MTELEGKDVLFLGLGKTAVCWYRCALPATFLGADWGGVSGPAGQFLTGHVRGGTNVPTLTDYKVVVLQQPRGLDWLRIIRKLKQSGIKVVYEIDDYLHGIHKVRGHDFAADYGKRQLFDIELCMRECDAMICSTEFLASRYRKFNRNTFVCRNGIDVGRYNLTLPQRPSVNVGWAGATGHYAAVQPWLAQVAETMRRRPDVCFVSVGEPYADAFLPEFGPTRALSVPWSMIDTYPAAMTHFDIAIAPAGKGNFFRGKSDLRWVEAGALGIPIIADPDVYPAIEHGVTGMHAGTAMEMGEHLETLLDDAVLRTRIGAAARAEIRATRGMREVVHAWAHALTALVD